MGVGVLEGDLRSGKVTQGINGGPVGAVYGAIHIQLGAGKEVAARRPGVGLQGLFSALFHWLGCRCLVQPEEAGRPDGYSLGGGHCLRTRRS